MNNDMIRKGDLVKLKGFQGDGAYSRYRNQTYIVCNEFADDDINDHNLMHVKSIHNPLRGFSCFRYRLEKL